MASVALGPREKSDESSELDFLWSFLPPCTDSDESEEDIWPVRPAAATGSSSPESKSSESMEAVRACWLTKVGLLS